MNFVKVTTIHGNKYILNLNQVVSFHESTQGYVVVNTTQYQNELFISSKSFNENVVPVIFE